MTSRRHSRSSSQLVQQPEHRAPDIELVDLFQRFCRAAARAVEAPTRAWNHSLWTTHCEPAWAAWPMNAITRMESQEWVNSLRSVRRARHAGRNVTPETAGVAALSAETICAAVHLMSGLFSAAMSEAEPLVTSNPFARLELPKIEPRTVVFYERPEAAALYAAAAALGSQ